MSEGIPDLTAAEYEVVAAWAERAGINLDALVTGEAAAANGRALLRRVLAEEAEEAEARAEAEELQPIGDLFIERRVWEAPALQWALAQARRQWDESIARECRYGYCVDNYDRRGRIFVGVGPVGCPHELRGGVRGHGTYAEQFAPAALIKPSKHLPNRRGRRRAKDPNPVEESA